MLCAMRRAGAAAVVRRQQPAPLAAALTAPWGRAALPGAALPAACLHWTASGASAVDLSELKGSWGLRLPRTAGVSAAAAAAVGGQWGLSMHGRRRPAAGGGSRGFSTEMTVHITDGEGDTTTIKVGPEAPTLMELALDHDLDLECACEGQLSCSTCHVYVDEVRVAFPLQ